MEWYRAKFIKTGSFGPVKHAMVRRWWWCCFSSFAMMISSSSSSSSSIFLRSQKRIFGLKVCLWESFDAEQHTSKRVLSLSLSSKRRENTACRLFFSERECQPFFSLSSLLCETQTTDWDVCPRVWFRTLHAPQVSLASSSRRGPPKRRRTQKCRGTLAEGVFRGNRIFR